MNTGPGGAPQLQLFMNYLNPNRWQIDEQEVLQGARLIHGALRDPKMREHQVLTSVQILTRKMQTYSRWYDLDGQTDVICTIIADIHHQGRGRRAEVQAALNASNKEQALIEIGSDNYLSRTKELARKIDSLRSQGKLGSKKYNEALNEFN
jgi:hypothetical protein